MRTFAQFMIMMLIFLFQPSLVYSADSTKITAPIVQSKKLITRIYNTDPSPTIAMFDPTTTNPSLPAIYYLGKIPASVPLSSCKIYKRNVTSAPRNFCTRVYLDGNGQWGRYYFLNATLPDSKFVYPYNFTYPPNQTCQTNYSTTNVKQIEAVVRGSGGGYRQMPENSNPGGGTPNHPLNPTYCTCEVVGSGSVITVQADWVLDNSLDITRIQGQYHTTPLQVVCYEYVS